MQQRGLKSLSECLIKVFPTFPSFSSFLGLALTLQTKGGASDLLIGGVGREGGQLNPTKMMAETQSALSRTNLEMLQSKQNS